MNDPSDDTATHANSNLDGSDGVGEAALNSPWKLKFFGWFLLADIGFVVAENISRPLPLPFNATFMQRVVSVFLVLTPFYLLAFALGLAAAGILALIAGRTGKAHRETTWYRALILSIFPALFLLMVG